MDEVVSKISIVKVKSIKKLLVICFAILSFAFALQYYGSKADLLGKSIFGETTAKIETWTEQTFWDIFIGNGFWQTRTVYTATPERARSSRLYSNRRLIAEQKNGSSLTQDLEYTKTERYGHSVSANVKGKASHIEAALEYKFTYETTESRTIKMHVASKTYLQVFQYDVQVRQQNVYVKTQKQECSWWNWKNTGNASYQTEKIVEYGGCCIEYVEYDI